MQIVIDRQWDGALATADERVLLHLCVDAGHLDLDIDAPFHRDPAPDAPPGRVPGLWNYEVVELFLFAADDHYLELEFGPHGHFLVLQLRGIRHICDASLAPLDYRCDPPAGGRWRGHARIDRAAIPPGVARWNAHAIHGPLDARRYLSAVPAGGLRPDFHQPEVSAPLAPALMRLLSHVPTDMSERT